ncbi:hypothetical protein [Streptomyces sp. NPDC046805]|uniref:hypothetical protein n=1 Tax=Streptomyces sp. NPDC046805 TaxID=3155134 RepID=UPI00340DD8F7
MFTLNVAQQRGLRNWVEEGIVPWPVVSCHVLVARSGRSPEAVRDLAARVTEHHAALCSRAVWQPDGDVGILRDAPAQIDLAEVVTVSEAPEESRVDPFVRSATVRIEVDDRRIGLMVTISHLFADAGGADSARRAFERAFAGPDAADPAVQPRETQEQLASEDVLARNGRFWLDALTAAPRSTGALVLSDRRRVTATACTYPLPRELTESVTRESRRLRLFASSIWMSAAAAVAWELGGAPRAVVCRTTSSNRQTAVARRAIDYRAQAVFVPIPVTLNDQLMELCSRVNRLNIAGLSRSQYDALALVRQLDTHFTGASFQPAIEVNYLPEEHWGVDAPQKREVTYRFNRMSAKADLAVVVCADALRITSRMVPASAYIDGIRERLLHWVTALFVDAEAKVGDIARISQGPADVRLHPSGVLYSMKQVTTLVAKVLQFPFTLRIDQEGRIVVHQAAHERAVDHSELRAVQAEMPMTVVPDEWVRA